MKWVKHSGNSIHIENTDQVAMYVVLEEDGITGNWMSAYVKRDGCVEVQNYFNAPLMDGRPVDEEDVDSMHICDLDRMIEALERLRDAAREQFGEEWGKWVCRDAG